MPKPLREFTEDELKTMDVLAASGVPYRVIAEVLSTSESVLSERFRERLADAKIRCNGKVAQTLYQMATSGRHPVATFFWLKTQAGWREVNHVQVSTGDGVDLSKLTTDELIQFEKLNAKASIAPANPSGD
jgi:hypothetical protein